MFRYPERAVLKTFRALWCHESGCEVLAIGSLLTLTHIAPGPGLDGCLDQCSQLASLGDIQPRRGSQAPLLDNRAPPARGSPMLGRGWVRGRGWDSSALDLWGMNSGFYRNVVGSPNNRDGKDARGMECEEGRSREAERHGRVGPKDDGRPTGPVGEEEKPSPGGIKEENEDEPGPASRGDATKKLLDMGILYAQGLEEGLLRRARELRGTVQQTVRRAGKGRRHMAQHEVSYHPLESTSPMSTIFKFIFATLSWFLSRFITAIVEDSFDEEDFLEGCKDAYFMVLQLFGKQDWETLKPMVSEKLFKVLKSVTNDYEGQGLIYSIAAEDIQSAFITGFYLLNSKAMAKFNPSCVDSRKGSVWVMVDVRILSRDRTVVTRQGGVVVTDNSEFRSDRWTFVRGPVNKLPVERSEQQWTLLSIS